MISFKHTSLKDFMKNQSPTNPTKEVIERFSEEIELLLKKAFMQDDEEFQKNEINKFLGRVYGYDCNTKGRVDSAIYVDGEAQVLIEAKAFKNKSEFPKDTPLSKAFYESVLYYLREMGDFDNSSNSNNSIKHIILCNPYDFYVFDATNFRIFLKNKKIEKLYKNCDGKEGTDKSTKKFFEEVEKHLKGEFEGELAYTHFSLKDKLSTQELTAIYQLLSPQVLLKVRKTLDANTLNKNFYEELLYILGLQEVSESGKSGGKILIKPSGTPNSLSDAIAKAYGNLDEETIFTLITTWNNRVLFLALLESMLLGFKHINKPFLDYSIIKDFGTLQSLFFDVLAKKMEDRSPSLIPEFASIPYLNSSLFDRIALEREGKSIGGLYPSSLQLFSRSILRKDPRFKDRESLPPLEYLFEFLHAYDFTTTPKDISQGVKQNHDKLINSAVLGLVFEKLNGYKEGSFYTPSFITSYMCKQSITQALIDKCNATYGWEASSLKDIISYARSDKIPHSSLLSTLLSLRICDPAVGSGHFLVSALNEMVSLCYGLGLLTSLPLSSTLELENDEILIKTHNELFTYTRPSSPQEPAHQIQVELFNLKKSIIENCLFGVDINPNSCEITKLRLWIELLKYSYYLFDESGANTNALETLPNIDINIKCGNSLISRFSLDDKLNKIKNIKKKIQEYKELVASYKNPDPLHPKDKTQLENKILELKVLFSLTLKDPKTKSELEKAIKTHIELYNDFALDDESLLEGLNIGAKNLFGTPELSPKEEEEAFASYGKIRALRKKLDSALSGEEYKNAFEWRFEFPEVLDEEGNFLGFDAIIGNPPYIRIQEMQSLANFYRKRYASCAKDAFDICILFLYQSMFLLKNNGNVSLILSNKFFKNQMGEKIRGFITQNSFLQTIIDFGTNQIFESATTYTGIITLKKAHNDSFLYKEFALHEDFHNLSGIQFDSMESNLIDCSPWSFKNVDFKKIIEKLKKQEYPFEAIAEKIAKGSSSGNDKIFLVDLIQDCGDVCIVESKRDKFQIEKDLLVPFLYGEDVKRLEKCRPTKFLIYPYNKENHKLVCIEELREKYPLALKYFSKVQDELMQRSLKMNNNDFYKYSALRNAETYQNKKILIPDILVCGRFGYDNVGLWHNASIHGIKLRDEFLNLEKMYFGILNSSLFWFFIDTTSTALRGDAYRLTPSFVSPFSFPRITESNQSTADKIIALVEKILEQKEKDPTSSTQELEKEIDSLVYALYNLTDEEIKIIEERE